MSYRVIDDTQTKEDNMCKMDKPLSEWTLKEVQEMCDDQDDCPGCPFYTAESGCMFSGEAASWPIGEAATMTTLAANGVNVPIKPDKPRLAELIGVNENEEWGIQGCEGKYRIHNGVRQHWEPFYSDWFTTNHESDLAHIINHPERIIRGPRLTGPEIAIMRAVGAKWVSYKPHDSCFVMLTKGKPEWDDKYQDYLLQGDEIDDPIGRIRGTLFPSVRPGDCISVEEATP